MEAYQELYPQGDITNESHEKNMDEEQQDSSREFDEDILNELDAEGCTIVQTSEYEDFLPGMFDFKQVNQRIYKNCYLCDVKFERFKKTAYQCKRCGQSVCDLCSRNMLKLSQIDKKLYKVCDMCEHEMLNSQIIRNMEQEKEEWKKQSKLELNILKRKAQIYATKEQTYLDWASEEMAKAEDFESKNATIGELEKQAQELVLKRN